MLKKEISSAVTYALSRGFQIHPDAFKILEKIDVKELQNIIKQVVREKAKQNMFLISQNDLKVFVESEVDETAQDNHVILFDPTKNVTSAEGIDGFTRLFSDRYSKLLKIMMVRSQSKKLTPIANVTDAKLGDETFIAGLLMDRRIDRDVTKLVIDDPTGSIEVLVFSRELQEIANSLLMDQFLMASIANAKNGGFITRELLVPDIPKHIKVFIIPGNHDPGRRALPQPAIPQKHNMSLWNRENFFMLGNPSLIQLNGVRILMFHGQSLDDVVGTTPGLSYAQPATAMRALLRTRHMSPIYGKRTPIAPELEDFMVINDVPDIYHSGHIHVVDLDMYKGTLIVNSGAWQTQTPYQAGVGINPTPGIAVIVNLATMKVFTRDFTENSS